MSREANYHEFTTLPAYTAPQWKGEKLVNTADPYRWSGKNPPPAIGTKVKAYVNKLGTGTVVGYFAEYGWLGVKVQPTRPPKWWRDQNPMGTHYCLFGIDLEPRGK